MELWHPPTDQPHLLGWWRPLIEASRAARLAKIPWSINIDEFVLSGRVDRKGRPSIWLYKHVDTGGELALDDAAQPYRFRRTPKGKGFGRFDKIDIRRAVWGVGLPEHTGASTWHEDWDEWGLLDDPEIAPWPLAPRATLGHPAGG